MKWLVALALVGCHRRETFDPERFGQIVEAVRARVKIVDKQYRLQLIDLTLDPSSLVMDNAMLARLTGRGRVRAAVSSDHKLAVSIETEDHGKAGESGYTYVDEGFPQKLLEGLQHPGEQDTPIDARWVHWTFTPN
jgi:UDP-N-acetylglucosamine 2-epimerase